MQVVGLYQIGLLRHLPEPPLPGLDPDRADASREAYAVLEVGDAFPGSSVTPSPPRSRRPAARTARAAAPWLPLALAGKAATDAFQGT